MRRIKITLGSDVVKRVEAYSVLMSPLFALPRLLSRIPVLHITGEALSAETLSQREIEEQ
jgi:hypothetical protein